MTSPHRHVSPGKHRAVGGRPPNSANALGPDNSDEWAAPPPGDQQVRRSLIPLDHDVSRHLEYFPNQLAGLFAHMILEGAVEAGLDDDGRVTYRGTPNFVATANRRQKADETEPSETDGSEALPWPS